MRYAVKSDLGWTGLANDNEGLTGVCLSCAAPKEKRLLITVRAAAFAFRNEQRKHGLDSKVVRVQDDE